MSELMVGSIGDATGTGSQYLSFQLAGETYGVDILRVQEIRGWEPVTKVPGTPGYVRGVLNLRGLFVPIIDLRNRFRLEEVKYTSVTVVIVVAIRTGDQERFVGMVVDGVDDVLNIEPQEIKPSPDFGTAIHTDFIQGLANVAESMVMLLDIDRMLTQEEIHELDKLD